MNYLNTGSITSIVQLLLSILAMIKPGVFTDDVKAQVGVQVASVVAAIAGIVHLVDELVAAWKAQPKIGSIGPDFSRLNMGLLLVGATLIFGSVGCSTSPAFQYGVSNPHSVPVLVSRASEYAGDDLTLAGQAQRLGALVADRQQVRFDEVDAAWSDVRPWFIDRSEADPVLNADVSQLYARRKMINSFDQLLAEEQRRRSLLGFLTPVPVPRPPTTRPSATR